MLHFLVFVTVLPANCSFGEQPCRVTVLSVNCPVYELSVGEPSVGELSVDEVSVYPVARDGTIVPRAIQFVCLVDVLRAQAKFASLSNCQKRRLVLCYYQTNL